MKLFVSPSSSGVKTVEIVNSSAPDLSEYQS